MHDESRSALTDASRPLAALSDDDLLRRLAEILTQSRRVERELIAHVAEVDERRLYAREAFPSMFAYCTGALHLSEAEAYLRIAVARATREHPILLAMLDDGRLHLSGIAQLAPHLTAENREALLGRATHRSKRQIEELIAEVAPREDVPALVRKLPVRRGLPAGDHVPAGDRLPAGDHLPPGNHPAASHDISEPERDRHRSERLELGAAERERQGFLESPALSGMGRVVTANPLELVEVPHGPGSATSTPQVSRPLPPPVVQPLAPGRYKVQFTASAGLAEKLERLQALMLSQVPDGDLGAIIEAAVTEKLARLETRRFATTSRPRKDLSKTDTSPASRHIPAAVRRAVRERDDNQCRFVDSAGRRCPQQDRLEYHHRHPFGLGGDHRPENIRLMCHRHNTYLAEHDYGQEAMRRFSRSGRRPSGVEAVASAGMRLALCDRRRPVPDRGTLRHRPCVPIDQEDQAGDRVSDQLPRLPPIVRSAGGGVSARLT